MKKQFLFCTFFFLLSAGAIAQHTDQHIIGSAGGTDHTGLLSVEWTLGEVAVLTGQNPALMLTEGFHQPVLSVRRNGTQVLREQVPEEGQGAGPIYVEVFPNPFHVSLEVWIQPAKNLPVGLTLTTMEGRVLAESEMAPGEIRTSLSLEHLPGGIYLLRIISNEGQFMQTFKVSKI